MTRYISSIEAQYLLDDIALIVSGDFRPAARVAPPTVSVVLAKELRLVVSSAATAPSVVNKYKIFY